MRFLILVFFVLTAETLSGQFGVRLKGQYNNFDKWDQVTRNVPNSPGIDLFQYSYELGIDYWFRLKNIRIEFYPEISAMLSSSTYSFSPDTGLPQSYKLQAGGIGINTHIYFMDLINDCVCPTFSKQNTFVKKGLFLLVGVKEYIQNKKTTYTDRTVAHRDFATQITAGLGLDIGLTDLFTLTPFFAAAYYPSTKWSGINANHGIVHVLPPDESTSNLAFQVGVRLGFRPDYVKRRR